MVAFGPSSPGHMFDRFLCSCLDLLKCFYPFRRSNKKSDSTSLFKVEKHVCLEILVLVVGILNGK